MILCYNKLSSMMHYSNSSTPYFAIVFCAFHTMPQNENIFADDMSLPDLFEVLGSHVPKRLRTQDGFESIANNEKGRSKGRYSSSDSSSKADADSLVQLLTKLCLRQEDVRNQMNLDRSFMLFRQSGKSSILPMMLLVRSGANRSSRPELYARCDR